ncbi:MAG TPA: 16S rRNA (cytidine(1402)-2'-O)-methyltransferase [Candidatus Magasanikbacteria bacterium]|mgnify:CR=1 FL=1|nr:16S rRNA (cytidine(1402)-2'-O)-methyltransferase [Candidatus Magasanikbacteria bacterium]
MNGKLYIIATPIGNLGDITLRALETFKSVDLILCEDTRVTKNLLDHYEINKPLISYHQHSTASKVKEIEKFLAEGKNIALVTDAGTPGISDPGNMLINTVIANTVKQSHGIAASSATPRNEAEIIPIPGPSAVIAALSISGFPTDRFTFMGFPPHKNKRQKYFKEVVEKEETVVFYESGHRILKCLKELKELLDPKRQIVVCRELTKKFETIYRGTIDEIIEKMKDERGEFVVIISRK